MDSSCPDQGTGAAKLPQPPPGLAESTNSRGVNPDINDSSSKNDVKRDITVSDQNSSVNVNPQTLGFLSTAKDSKIGDSRESGKGQDIDSKLPSSEHNSSIDSNSQALGLLSQAKDTGLDDSFRPGKGQDFDSNKTTAQPTYSSEHLLPLLSHSQPSSPTDQFPSSPPGNGANDGETGAASGTVRRPMNGFLIFCKRQRATVRKANPELDNRSITRVLGDLWSKLGPEKATYTNLAKKNKEVFLKANPNYKWSGERVQTGATRSSRKAESVHAVKENATAHGAVTLENVEGTFPEPVEKKMLASQSASVSHPVPSSTPSTAPITLTHTITDKGNKETIQHNALLQLAEMCSSEASIKSTAVSDSPAHVSSGLTAISQPSPVSSPAVLNTTGTAPSSLGPLKKRAKHWGKPNESDTASDRDRRQHERDMGISFHVDSRGLGKIAHQNSESKGNSFVPVNGFGRSGHGDPRGYEEFRQSQKESLSVLKFSSGQANDTRDNGNVSHLRETPRVYPHPSAGVFEARGTNHSKEGDPLNLSLPRNQDLPGTDSVSREGRLTAIMSEPSQRLNESNFAPSAAPASRASFGETYASVEWYKSANHRYRKVSSSATESIPCLSPPPPHHSNDEVSHDLANPSQHPTIPNSRWHHKPTLNEKYNSPHPDSECMDPKFFQLTDRRTKLPAVDIPSTQLSNSLNSSFPTSDSSSISPATSIVARMMMQQPQDQDRLTRAGSEYLSSQDQDRLTRAGFEYLSSHDQDGLKRASSEYLSSSQSPTVASGKIPTIPVQQGGPWAPSTRPDMLSKLLAVNVSTGSTKPSYDGSTYNRNPDFHQWRDPQGTTLKLGRDETQTSSPTTSPLTAPAAQLVARHQLPLAMPTQTSNPLLSSAKTSAPYPVTSLSILPGASTLSPLSLSRSSDRSTILSSHSVPLPNPRVYRQADVTTVSLDTQTVQQEAKEMQDLRVAPQPVLDKTKLNPTKVISYSEGKLKKKWTQRMLVEEKMEEDRLLSLQASGDSQKTLPGSLDHLSWASPKLAHTLSDNADHIVKTGTPSSILALDNSSSSIVPKYVSHPTGKTFSHHGNTFESISVVPAGLNFQRPQDGGATTSTSIMFSMQNSIVGNSALVNNAGKNVLSLGGTSNTNLSAAFPSRPPYSGPCVTATGSSILSTCLMSKQPLTTVKSSTSTLVTPQPRSFNASSHPKLMLQLSKGTSPSPAVFANSPTSATAQGASSTLPFQNLTSSVVPNHCEKTNNQANLPYSTTPGVLSSSQLLPFTSNSLLLPSTSSSPLLVISSNIGQPSDTLKVDLGAGGWRTKTSPSHGDDLIQSERLVILKDSAPVSKLTLTPPAGADVLKLVAPLSKPADPALLLPSASDLKQKNPKSEKLGAKKGPKGPRKSAKKDSLTAANKDMVNKDTSLPQQATNTTRGKRKKKDAVPQSGEQSVGDKPKAKRGRKKAGKKEDETATPVVAPPPKEAEPAVESHSNLLDKMRILNPIAACGKKIVDHIVEQFVKSSDFDDELPDKSDPFILESSLYSKGKGSLFFARPREDGLNQNSTVNTIAMKTSACEDRLKAQDRFPLDVKPDVHQALKQTGDGKLMWQSAREKNLGVKHEPGIFGGLHDSTHKLKSEEDGFKSQLRLFGEGEQLKLGKLESGREADWSSKLFKGSEAIAVPVNVKQEDCKSQKVFGGSRPWMGEAEGRERNLFPACSLVERVVREVCGSSPEKRNCFSCERKEDLPAFSKPGQTGDSNLTKVQDIMLGKSGIPGHNNNFTGSAIVPNQRSSVWNTYRQNNDSPTNDELENQPQLATGSRPLSASSAKMGFPSQGGMIQQGYHQQWKNINTGVSGKTGGTNGSKGGCLSMADLIEHHLHQQEVEDQRRRQNDGGRPQLYQGEEEDEEEEEGEQLQSQPVRKSRRANRGQKYQELIKEGFIQPSRDRVARGSSSQEEQFMEVSLEQRKGLKRRGSERDIPAAPSPLPVGGLSRSSSVSSQSRSSTRKSSPSFDLEKEAGDNLAFETGSEKRRKLNGASTGGRTKGDYSQDVRSFSSACDDSVDAEEKAKIKDCGSAQVPSTAPSATAVAVTGSRKRKARRHCITRISVVGQVQISDSHSRSSEQDPGKDAKDGPVQKAQRDGQGEGKPTSAPSAAAGSVLISPACKDLISPQTEKVVASKPASSNVTTNDRSVHNDQSVNLEKTKSLNTKKEGASVLAISNIPKQDMQATILSQLVDTSNSNALFSNSTCQRLSPQLSNYASTVKDPINNNKMCDRHFPKGPISQDDSLKSENFPRDSLQSAVVPTIAQQKVPSFSNPDHNIATISPQDKDCKLKKSKKVETPRPKKASKLRKALLSEESEVNKSALDSESGNTEDAKITAPGPKGKRAKVENCKNKSPPVKKPRKKAGDIEDSQPPKGKKSKPVKGSENANNEKSKKKTPKKEKSLSSPSAHSPSIQQVAASNSSMLIPPCQFAKDSSKPGNGANSRQINSPATAQSKPKSAILSAILASAPLVDRPTVGLGGTYLSGKPLDPMNTQPALGLKTLSGLPGFSGSPKSPGQADTAEIGRTGTIGLCQTSPSTLSAGTTLGIPSNTQKALPPSSPNPVTGKNVSNNKSKLASSPTTPQLEQMSSSRALHPSPVNPGGGVTTLSLPSSKSGTNVALTSTPSSAWATGSAAFVKSSLPVSAASTMATALPQSVRGSPALPVAASSDVPQ